MLSRSVMLQRLSVQIEAALLTCNLLSLPDRGGSKTDAFRVVFFFFLFFFGTKGATRTPMHLGSSICAERTRVHGSLTT
jgi:hypothetical protein